MQKEEVILLHQLLVHIKEEIESMVGKDSVFEDYINLGISPIFVTKNKEERIEAIFCLGKCIAKAFSKLCPTDKSHFEKTAKRFGVLLQKE